jgi:hypothetical protein
MAQGLRNLTRPHVPHFAADVLQALGEYRQALLAEAYAERQAKTLRGFRTRGQGRHENDLERATRLEETATAKANEARDNLDELLTQDL